MVTKVNLAYLGYVVKTLLTSGAKIWIAFLHSWSAEGEIPDKIEKCLHHVELATWHNKIIMTSVKKYSWRHKKTFMTSQKNFINDVTQKKL